MTPWQVLRAGGAVQAALGSRYHHGQGGLVHYSTAAAAAAAAAPDGSRSFCLSSEKLTLQQLNGRLASYLQQVQCLEETNQRLEVLIQQELDRKCPGELRELEGHLRTVSLLQEQIRERLSDQAGMKLQLLHAELIVHDLSVRYEKEQERHGSLEAELSNLRLLAEELQVHRLPELQMLLKDQTQQLMELQIQHQQDMQRVAAQMSGGLTVEMQPAQSLDLTQQLHHLRRTDVTLLDNHQNDIWFNTQVSVLNSPEVTLDPPAGSEVVLAELEELRTTAASLEQELTQLQALNVVLEASCLQQNESIVQELLVLQQGADGLCSDLDSVLQLTAQQVLDHQILLDVTTRLEAEIEDYRRLLDGLSPRGFSGLRPNSAANLTSVCATSSPSFLRRRDFTVNEPVRKMEFQAASSGHMQTIQQTPVVTPLTETVTAVQSVSKHLKNQPVTLTDTSSLNASFQKSESQTAENPKVEVRESMTISATRSRQSRFWEDKVQAEGLDSQNSSTVTAQISRGFNKGSAVQASAQGVTVVPSDTPSLRGTEATLQANEQKTVIKAEMTKTSSCTGPEMKQTTHLITAATDASEQTAAELKTETVQMTSTEGSIQAEDQDPAQDGDLGLQTPAEAQGEISVESNLICGNNLEGQEMKDEKEVEVQNSSHVVNKTETIISKQTTTEAFLQDKKTETNIQTEITKTIVCVEPEVKQEPQMKITDPSERTAAEVKTETETVISVQMTSTEGSIQAEDQDPVQDVDLGLQTPAEAVKDAEEVAATASFVSGSDTDGTLGAQEKISGDLTLMEDNKTERQEKKEDKDVVEVKSSSSVVRVDQITSPSNESRSEQIKVTEEVHTRSDSSKDNPDGKTEQGATALETTETTAAGLQEKIETNIETVITKTIVCVEPEVKQEPQTKITDPREQTAAELQRETETVISVQMTSTEGSIQAEDQDPVQDVDLGLQTPAEAVKDAEEVAATASFVSGSTILRSEEVQGKISGDLTPMEDNNTERQEKKEDKDVVEVESSSSVVRVDQITSPSNESRSEQIKVTEEVHTRSDISNDNPEGKTEQSATTLETTETTAAGLQKNETETNIETVITKTIVCVEPEVKQEPQTKITDPSERTAAELQRETETVISVQMTSTEGSIQAEDQDPVQDVDLGLQTPAEAVKDAEEVAATASFVSGSTILRSEEVQGKISGDLTLMEDNNTEKKEDENVLEVQSSSHVVNLDQTAASSDATSSEQVKVMEEAHTGSDVGAEGSTQPQNCDPVQVVTLSLETSPEAAGDAEKCAVTASFVSGSHVLISEEAQDKVPCDLTLMNDNNTERQGEEKGEEEEGTLSICGLDQKTQLSDAPDSEQVKEMKDEHTGSETAPASSDCAENGDNLESKTAQSVTASVPETQSITSAAVQERTETLISKNTTTAAGLQENKTETKIQTAITKPSVCAESGAKKGPHSATHPTNAEQTAAEVKKEAETVISAQTASTEGSTQAKNQDPVQVVSQTDPSKPTRLDQTSASSDVFKSEQKTVMKDADVKSGPESISSDGRSLGQTSMSFSNTGTTESPSEVTSHAPTTGQQETRRFSSRGSGEWLANGGSLGRKINLNGRTSLLSNGKEEGQSVAANPTTNTQETGRFGSSRSAEWIVYSGSLGRKSSLRRSWSEENHSGNMNPSTSLPEIRRYGSGGRGSLKTIFSLVADDDVPNANKEESPSVTLQKASSTPEALGRFGSGGSGDWRVYGGSTGKSSSAGSTDNASNQKISQPSKYRSSEPRLGSTGSTGSTGGGMRLSSGSISKHTNSAGSGGGLSSSSSGGMLGGSSASQRISTSRKFTSTGSGEWKPVYSSANARKSSVGSSGRSGGGGPISSQRAPSSGGRMIVNMGSGGWLSSSTAGVSSPGSGSKLSSSGGSDRISILAGAKISSSSGSGRTNITGGRVISSSDRPVRSTGSGAGGNKERISVCKMAALSISAAGRERNQGKQEQPQRPQQKQQGGASSPLLQRWLTAGVGIKSVHPDELDDIIIDKSKI